MNKVFPSRFIAFAYAISTNKVFLSRFIAFTYAVSFLCFVGLIAICVSVWLGWV